MEKEEKEVNLDTDELTLLVEALDTWVDKDGVSDVLDTVLASLNEDPKPDKTQKLADRREIRIRDKKLRKERAILVQAKLLQMRDMLVAENI